MRSMGRAAVRRRRRACAAAAMRVPTACCRGAGGWAIHGRTETGRTPCFVVVDALIEVVFETLARRLERESKRLHPNPSGGARARPGPCAVKGLRVMSSVSMHRGMAHVHTQPNSSALASVEAVASSPNRWIDGRVAFPSSYTRTHQQNLRRAHRQAGPPNQPNFHLIFFFQLFYLKAPRAQSQIDCTVASSP